MTTATTAYHRSTWMDDEVLALGDLAGKFFAKECTPNEPRWREQKHVDRDVWLKAGELGLLCLSIPEQYGGGGGTFAHEAAMIIEQVRQVSPSLGNPVHSGIVAHYLLNYGSEELKKSWLPRMATGEAIGAIAMTEPGTGSDLQSIASRARADGDEFVISGSKTFISNGFMADLIVVACQTVDEDGNDTGMSLILVEADREGFSRGRNLDKIGLHGQDTCELAFDNVRVPRSNLLGTEPGQGFVQLIEQLPQERLVLALSGAAAIETCVRVAVDYTRERTAFGKPVAAFQNTKFVLAECDTLATVAWAFADDCVSKHLRGELDVVGAAKAKWWLTEQQCVVADRCLQLFGGYGFMSEYPIAHLYADSRIQKIYGGTNEIMKIIVAKGL